MPATKVLQRHAAPAGRPHPLAVHDGALWVGCWDSKQLFAIDTATWTVRESADLPGRPFGIAPLGGVLRVVVSIGDDDDRYFYRYVPGKGLEGDAVPCPALTGSHIASDGISLFLTQLTLSRVLELGPDYSIRQQRALSSRLAGIASAGGNLFAIKADADFDVLEFATVALTVSEATLTAIAPMSEEARGLAFDGKTWWTNYRELSQIVAFAVEP